MINCSIFFSEQWRYALCSLICFCFGVKNTLSAQNQKINNTGTILDELQPFKKIIFLISIYFDFIAKELTIIEN
jgi:hypothetical protein